MGTNKRDERIGETRMMNCGMEATIIEYHGSGNIDVKFSNGTIVFHKNYYSFKNGKILNPNSRVGEVKTMNCGETAEIIEYYNSHNITIKFADGFIRRGVYYTDFKRGVVKKKDGYSVSKSNKVGKRLQMKNGSWCTCVKYINCNNCCFRFDNGYETKTSYARFRNREISNGSRYIEIKKELFINKINKSKQCNLSFMVKKDYGDTALVVFDDDSELIASWNRIVYGNVRPKLPKPQKPRKVKVEYEEGFYFETNYGKHFVVEAKKTSVYYCRCIEDNLLYSTYSIPLLIKKQPTSLAKAERNNLSKYNYVKQHLGETFISNRGEECIIIGGTDCRNLDIQFKDGTIKHNISYYRLTSGKFSQYSGSQILTENQKNNRLGETIITKKGEQAKIIKYSSFRNVVIEFENGNQIITTYDRFKKGLISSNTKKKYLKTSVNEFTVLYALRPYGFEKYPTGSLKDIGFGNRELDLYNKQYNIAIEYDGMFHNKLIKKDKAKDKLCKDAGISIIRIRERCIQLSDGISKEFVLNDGHYFSPALQECLNQLCVYLSEVMKIEINPLNLLENQENILKEYCDNTDFAKRVGESFFSKEGERGVITTYRGYSDIDVKFENGYEAFHRKYGDAVGGKISCLYNHYGEEGISKRGEKMKVVSSVYGNRVDVEFPNGYIAKNVYYSAFLNGRVSNKEYKPNFDSYIGKEVLCKNGLKATIINAYYKKAKNNNNVIRVDVQFTDGVIAKDISYTHYLNGYVKYPLNKKYIGQTNTNTKGRIMKIINYHSANNVDVEFEDGVVVYNKTYANFKKHHIGYLDS